MQLITDSVDAARDRITLFRMAFGHTSTGQRISCNELATLLHSFDRNGRLRVNFDATGDLPRSEGRMVILALMCLETAMPWGGRVLICRGARGWRLVAEATRVKVDPTLWSWLDKDGLPLQSGQLPDLAPSEVQFGLLAMFAGQECRTIHWEMDENGGEIAF
ncbi:histidine phosphotransferase family protein [Paracoccus cavernae]|uniref:Histidine phosphotransferase family protein n=1 Tax=Paracoccus cavernae TaxID=1571207 RepID=A0ABT8D9Y0_9RHOB|nr:histidine phosphotransferase family protein [Paracoccus cavernae]